MSGKKDEYRQLIITVFDNESAAVGAQAGMEHWADSRRDIKLGAIGFLQMDDGEVKTTLIRKEGRGVLVNGAVGLVKSMLGPLALVGDVVGGVARSIFGNDSGETPEAFQKLSAYMDVGGVTMVMLADPDVTPAFSAQLQSMGGRVTLYAIPQEVLDEAAAALEEAQAAESGE